MVYLGTGLKLLPAQSLPFPELLLQAETNQHREIMEVLFKVVFELNLNWLFLNLSRLLLARPAHCCVHAF